MFFYRQCDYYTYKGSITTPLCYESVRWVIFKEPIMVSEEAVSNIANMMAEFSIHPVTLSLMCSELVQFHCETNNLADVTHALIHSTNQPVLSN